VCLSHRSRSDNAVWWPGAIADVAFYNTPLTPEQIGEAFSVTYFASTVTTEPVGPVSERPGSRHDHPEACVSGFPNTYQWYKTESLSSEKTTSMAPRTILGRTSPTLVITKSSPLIPEFIA